MVVNFKGFAKNTIEEEIDNYRKSEWDLQENLISEVIKRMSNIELTANG